MKLEVKNGWNVVNDGEKDEVFSFSEGYKKFLNSSKTERESVSTTVLLAEKAGFRALEDCESLKPGDRVYAINKNKGIMLAVIGSKPMVQGVNIVGSHIDSPRLDLKQNPLFEDGGMAFFKTHYYGGIKKYQWSAIPLAIHGVVVRADGTKTEISVGDYDDDVTFVITDLLPHLGRNQMGKNGYDIIGGEDLTLLLGSMPFEKEDDEAEGYKKGEVKSKIMSIISERYGISEADFISAELEIVPAFEAKDLGFDRSLIASYGHDDRVCAYPAVKALFDVEIPERTAVTILTDKEEVGSMGNSGAKSYFMQLTLATLMEKAGENPSDINRLRMLDRSYCLSADVSAAFDPKFGDVYDKSNSGVINGGIAVSKYTGSGGKSGSNDASAELCGLVRKIFDDNGVVWHTAELGKVDAGGGGTIAQFVSNLGVNTIDCGVPVLSMHAPYEVVAKMDVYMSYKAFLAFYKDCK
jgi:aspartyl aminopeptidase